MAILTDYFKNIENFYKENRELLLESNLRPSKSITRDIFSSVKKFTNERFLLEKGVTIEEIAEKIFGKSEINDTVRTNIRIMEEFHFLKKQTNKYYSSEILKKFLNSDLTIEEYLENLLLNISSLDSISMLLNSIICTLREGYLEEKILEFPESASSFKESVPDFNERETLREKIKNIYGFTGSSKKSDDRDYTPNANYRILTPLKSLGYILLLDNKNINGLKSYILTPKSIKILKRIDDNLNFLVKDFSTESSNRSLSIKKTHQKIFFGAPGTGKSYEVSKLIKKTYRDLDERENPFVFRTTIYKDYSYYDFVGTIMPVNDGKKITYQFKPGIFTEALFRAIKCPNNDIFLVIEEMSRGNISGIFGDIFQLLDRDKEGNSEYSITNDLISKYFSEEGMTGFDKIILPSNLHIIGTVNTSDQNVNVIDTAFKRRFDFVYSDVSPIKNNETGEYLNSYRFELEDEKFEWNKFYMTINDFIVEELSLSEDKQIGQFFIKFDNYTTAEDKFNAIKNKLLHYLWEDVKEASFRETNIFKENKSFLKLYKDFEKKKNIFSGNFMKKYEELVLTDE